MAMHHRVTGGAIPATILEEIANDNSLVLTLRKNT